MTPGRGGCEPAVALQKQGRQLNLGRQAGSACFSGQDAGLVRGSASLSEMLTPGGAEYHLIWV